jgi:hypothetical protein
MQSPRKRWWSRWFGKVEREVGEATGDRTVEARGAVREHKGATPAEHEVDRSVDDVRVKHGDVIEPPARGGTTP